MKLFDTHAHLSDEAFDKDRAELIPLIFERGISRVIDVACDVRRANDTVELIDQYPFIYGTVGMHPHYAKAMSVQRMDEIRGFLRHDKMLALGEIGLDYHYDLSDREAQKQWFDAQLSLAEELDVPVVLHVREAAGDAMDILRAHRKGLRGVMHCFSGSWETARECMDMGLYIAFGGAITFHNAVNQREIVKRMPANRLLLETDCPYMTPVPYRGKRNDPIKMIDTANMMADIRNEAVEDTAAVTYANACDVFGLSD